MARSVLDQAIVTNGERLNGSLIMMAVAAVANEYLVVRPANRPSLVKVRTH